MGVRARLGKGLEATLGEERTNRVRKAERRTRQRLTDKLTPLPVDRAPSAEPAVRMLRAEAGSGRQRSAAW